MRAIDFVIPGFSTWSRMDLKRLRANHVNDGGLLLAVHYPPWSYRLAMARRDALWLQVAIDRGESLTMTKGEKTVWRAMSEGTHFIRVENFQEHVVFDTFFEVRSDVPTTIELWPALAGIVFPRARPYRLTVSVPESASGPAAMKCLTHA